MSDIKKENYSIITIINNKIYDLTTYVETHPGGRRVLENTNMKDSSEMFVSAVHSKAAIEKMKDFLIGEINEKNKIVLYSSNEILRHKLQSRGIEYVKEEVELFNKETYFTSLLKHLSFALVYLIIFFILYYFKSKNGN